jgi:hypothetical protein
MNLGNPQSFNRYSYVENEPTNFIDPSGLNYQIWRCETRCTRNCDDEFGNGCGPWDCETCCELVMSGGGGVGPTTSGTTTGGDPGGGGGGNPPFTSRGDKIPRALFNEYKCRELDDCDELEDKIDSIAKSVRRRRVELDPDSPSYVGHADVWASEKNDLNKCHQLAKSKNCKNKGGGREMPVDKVVEEH